VVDRPIELLFAAVVLGGLATSLARTVVVPRDRSSRLMRAALRTALTGARSLPPPRLSPSQRPALLDLVLPISLFVTLAGWLAGLAAGFVLLAWRWACRQMPETWPGCSCSSSAPGSTWLGGR